MTIDEYWKSKELELRAQRDRHQRLGSDARKKVKWAEFLPEADVQMKVALRGAADRVAYLVVTRLVLGWSSFLGAWRVWHDMLNYGRLGMFQYWRPSNIANLPWQSISVLGSDEDLDSAFYMYSGPLERDRIVGNVANLFFDYSDQKPMYCVYPARDGMPDDWTAFSWYTYQRGNQRQGLGKLIPESIAIQAKELQPLLDEFVRRASLNQAAAQHEQDRDRLDVELGALATRRFAWSEIVLPDDQVIELMKQADMFLANDPARPQATMLKGVPGTGKTLLAGTLAKAMGCNFIKATLADLKSPNLGESGQRVRELWENARLQKPVIVFVDECESIFGKRGAAETDAIAADMTQAFLGEWNAKEDGVWLIGATNRRDMIDEAIMSRFGSELEIALPNEQIRRKILRKELIGVGFRGEIPSELGALTQGMSGRDLYQLARKVMTAAYPRQPERAHFLTALHATRKAGNTSVDAGAVWDSLVLDEETLSKLKTTCSLLKDSEAWSARGITIPTGLLLCGNPGTGKTQIARTMANEGGLAFIGVSTSDLKANFLGQSGNKVKNLFERARSQSPCILFLDELDIVAPSRENTQNDALTSEIVGQLLQEMDGIRQDASQVFVLAATNHPSMIDSAILSRMQERITIPMPDKSGRLRLLKIMLSGKKLAFSLADGAKFLVERSDQMSGRDIKNWIAKAEQSAVTRALGLGGPDRFALGLADFSATRTAEDFARADVTG